MIQRCGKCEANTETKGPESGARYQDETYGKGMRVHTPKADATKATCTVCGTVNAVAKGGAK